MSRGWRSRASSLRRGASRGTGTAARVHARARVIRPVAICAIAICAVALGCGPGADSGRSPGADTAPEPSRAAAVDARRIVSLAPSLTRVLIALGASESVVGVDRFSAELAEVAEARDLGGLYAPDLEQLVELRPTLVVGVRSAQQEAFFEQVRARGTRVETFRLHSLEQVMQAFERVGGLVGAPEAGRALARSVREGLDQLSLSTRGRPRPRVALVVDREPLFIVGGGSFAHALIELAGGENVFADLRGAYPRVSLESLAGRAPDVLLETTEPGESASRAARDYWSRFDFVKRFEPLPRGDVVLPSPELVRAARLLRDAIHPELREAGPP